MNPSQPKEKKKSVIPESTSYKTIIRGEKVYSQGRKQFITIELSEDFITLWSKHTTLANQKEGEVFLYIYHRQDKTIWCGNITPKKCKRRGKVIEPHNQEYLCAINGMKSYVSDLFLLRPNDMNILEVLDELNGQDSDSHNFLRLLFKLLN